MAQKQDPHYGVYDRTLDWFSDNRQLIAKAFVMIAVLGMVATLVLSAVLA